MIRVPQAFSSAFLVFLFVALSSVSTLAQRIALAQQIELPQQTPAAKKEQKEQDDGDSKKDKRARRAAREKETDNAETSKSNREPKQPSAEESVEIVSDKQSKTGDLFLYEGYVNAIQGEIRLQADRVTFNSDTDDMTAEGNVIFDQGTDQRVTAHRAEINWRTKKGTFWDTTGFTNRTQTGDYVFFTAARVEKTSPDTYELFDANVTACEDVIPKWSFKTRHAELKMGDRVTMSNAVFQIKTLPAFVLL